MNIPKFNTQKELFNFLIENEKDLTSFKKHTLKTADAFSYSESFDIEDKEAYKGVINNEPILEELNTLKLKLVINTTNWLDSHGDVHIQGLWSKSVSEQKLLYLLQEHKMEFDHIISDEVIASTQSYTWKQLGLQINGKTEALVFDANINKSRNEFMFKQYAQGYVKNHSVGMRYVKMYLCINDSGSGQYFDYWNKYIKEVANEQEAKDRGWFYAVTEAKLVEGSAVVMGSNIITPTLENNMKAVNTLLKQEPTKVTQRKRVY